MISPVISTLSSADISQALIANFQLQERQKGSTVTNFISVEEASQDVCTKFSGWWGEAESSEACKVEGNEAILLRGLVSFATCPCSMLQQIGHKISLLVCDEHNQEYPSQCISYPLPYWL